MRRLVVIVLAGLAAWAPPAGAAISVDDRLTFTRPDGSAVGFPRRVRVWCGPWADAVPVRSIHVLVGGRHGRWQVDAVLADVRRRPVLRLPRSFVFDAPHGAGMFAGAGGIEASSAVETAGGRITFERARCRGGPRIRIRVDAVLGSEFIDGEPLAVKGTFAAAQV